MKTPNYYTILQVHHTAPQNEIKRAYRQLVKQYHPDLNHGLDNHEKIAQINVAYETLSNPKSRASYDISIGVSSQNNTNVSQRGLKTRGKTEDERVQEWITKVYEPICQFLGKTLPQLQDQIDALADDPFDDQLMSVFLDYLATCRSGYSQAQRLFRQFPNPSCKAAVAEYLFHCLNQLGDGIEELYYFTNNLDDRHLHTGIELWRIAEEMYQSAKEEMSL
ncbi:MAG: DnaJ domain-containing protein [Pseudanabaenaceae cyanobacterium SKYGB_i_bin29]|nr:DnaJ domain-containing protein [Pseudanabaenaceae cyanobacterium SKYG29]MDW8421585.1 DnaJ domain-containing protein [Pseudanabaenaceae cyanobacterium SKYGB_i_bin29]